MSKYTREELRTMARKILAEGNSPKVQMFYLALVLRTGATIDSVKKWTQDLAQ